MGSRHMHAPTHGPEQEQSFKHAPTSAPEFRPAFQPEPEATPAAHHSREHDRSVGRTALKLDLAQEVQGVEWSSVRRLAEGPRQRLTPQRERRIERYAPLVTAVASALAHKMDARVPFKAPTAEDIKETNGLAKFISSVLHFFNAQWGERFDGWLVKTATRRIQHIAERAKTLIDSLAEIDKPKSEFLDELQAFYQHIRGQADQEQPDKNALTNAARTAYGRRTTSGRGTSWYDPEQFPLVSKVLTKATSYHETPVQRAKLRAATPEIMHGIEIFLAQHDRPVEPMPDDQPASLARRAATKYEFGRRRLAAVTHQVRSTLEHIYAALPDSGDQFADDIQTLSKKIVHLTDQGYSGQEIADQLRQDVWPKRPPSEL